MKLVVLDDYADAFRGLGLHHRLVGHEVVVFRDTEKDPARLAARLDGADAVLLTQQRSGFPRAVVERLTTVRTVVQTGRATGHLDLAALSEKGIAVVAAGQGDPASVAELTWALILASQRHLVAEANRLRAGAWLSTTGTGLAGTTLGVWGLGRIGTRVAGVGAAFGMRVVVLGREVSTKKAQAAGYEVAASQEAFFAEADVLSVHLPLGPETRGLVTAADLARMKPTALFVNTSRAGLVAPGALAAAVRAGRPGRAAVDVFDDEPVLGAADPLLSLDGVLATPHLGYVEARSLAALYGAALDALFAHLGG